MHEDDYEKHRRELSKLNEIRKKWWDDFRSLRDELLRKYDPNTDQQCLELYRLINDMWESGFKEELRRQIANDELRKQKGSIVKECLPKTDQQCLELDELKGELQRKDGWLPNRDIPISPPDRDIPISPPGRMSVPKGLYENNHLCPVCGLPITGNSQKKYCSEPCRTADKARRYRKNNPDEVMISKFHYLDDVLTEEEKER